MSEQSRGLIEMNVQKTNKSLAKGLLGRVTGKVKKNKNMIVREIGTPLQMTNLLLAIIPENNCTQVKIVRRQHNAKY